jgi:hemerythrin-like domain-containing protein
MMPIGPLMIEHRLIERMIRVLGLEVARIEKEKKSDPLFIHTAADFIRTYADRCHHGKEEDILFRELKKKNLSAEHARILSELEEEHRQGRMVVGRLAEANEKYARGDITALTDIVDALRWVTDFYPTHIEKEDKHFFIPIMGYFTQEEKDVLLREGYEFDRQLVHERYRSLVASLEKAGQ